MKKLAALILILVAGLVVSTTASYATDANYTDGTVGSDLNGNDWGAPPGAPTFDVEDGSVCIDPPQQVWMTLHVLTDGEETDSLTFEYVHTTPGYACTPYELPLCPVEEIEVYGTWNIGTGRSPSLFVDNDCPDPLGEVVVSATCESGNLVTLKNVGEAAWTVDGGLFDGQTIEPGADSTVDVGRVAGSLTVNFSAGPKSGEASTEWADQAECPVPAPAVELAPPAAITAVPVAEFTPAALTGVKEHPKTGATTTTLAGIGIAVLALGLVMVKTHTAKRGLTV